MKRAPDNVRYLEQFGKHILTRIFTARDPVIPAVPIDWPLSELAPADKVIEWGGGHAFCPRGKTPILASHYPSPRFPDRIGPGNLRGPPRISLQRPGVVRS